MCTTDGKWEVKVALKIFNVLVAGKDIPQTFRTTIVQACRRKV
jgi:hypothetical protein